MLDRVERSRRRRNAGEQARLAKSQVGRAGVEVRLCRRLGAIRLVAEIDRVQIHLENLVLAVLPRQRDRQRRLAQLALQRIRRVGTEVQLLDELLGDGASPFDEAKVNQIVQGGPQDRGQVDAAVLVIPAVFDGDAGMDQGR